MVCCCNVTSAGSDFLYHKSLNYWWLLCFCAQTGNRNVQQNRQHRCTLMQYISAGSCSVPHYVTSHYSTFLPLTVSVFAEAVLLFYRVDSSTLLLLCFHETRPTAAQLVLAMHGAIAVACGLLDHSCSKSDHKPRFSRSLSKAVECSHRFWGISRDAIGSSRGEGQAGVG